MSVPFFCSAMPAIPLGRTRPTSRQSKIQNPKSKIAPVSWNEMMKQCAPRYWRTPSDIDTADFGVLRRPGSLLGRRGETELFRRAPCGGAHIANRTPGGRGGERACGRLADGSPPGRRGAEGADG